MLRAGMAYVWHISSVKPRSRKQSRSRTGLRIVGSRGPAEVRACFIRFARWLRTQYDFPIHVPVYLTKGEYLRTMHGEWVAASFFQPFSRNVEPYIRVSTGDYLTLRRERGRDHALGAFLHSLCHELVHYQQWLETGRCWERGVAVRAGSIVRRYSFTTRSP